MAIALVSFLGGVYVILVGASDSALRAWVMTCLALCYASGRVYVSRVCIFFVALVVVLIFDPLAPLNSGFWYSFLAVAALLILFASKDGKGSHSSNLDRPEQGRFIISLVSVQVLLLLALMPINVQNGVPVTALSLLANMFAVPWVSFVVLPVCVLSILCACISQWMGSLALTLANFCIELMMGYLEALAALPWTLSISTNTFSIVLFSVLVMGMLVLRAWSGPFRVLCMLACMFTLSPKHNAQANHVLVFDVGQGLALSMQWGDQWWLYDTGPGNGDFAMADQTLRPYVAHQNTHTHLSGMVISHADMDHASGIDSVLTFKRAGVLISGEPERLGWPLEHKCRKGMRWEAKNAQMEVLYPFDDHPLGSGENSNNRSCVVRLQIGSYVFLLPGDLEREGERALVEHYGAYLKADVLIAGHHGAKNSSTMTFLKYVRPKYVVVSRGYQNSFGHPHPKMVSRVAQIGSQLIDTARVGAVLFEVGKELKVKTAREARQAPWYFTDWRKVK